MAYIEAGEGRVAGGGSGGGSSSRSMQESRAFVVLRARKEMRAHGGNEKGNKNIFYLIYLI